MPIAGRAAAMPWQIMQRVDHPDPAQANAQALHDLENGATGLTLVFAGANGAHGFGLDPSAEAIEKILDGIFLDAGIALDLQIGPQSRMAAIHVAELVKRKGFSPAACDIRFGLDPLGACAVWGSSPYSLVRDRAGGHKRGAEVSPASASRARSSPPTGASCMTPAVPRRRSLPLRWRPASPICARSNNPA